MQIELEDDSLNLPTSQNIASSTTEDSYSTIPDRYNLTEILHNTPFPANLHHNHPNNLPADSPSSIPTENPTNQPASLPLSPLQPAQHYSSQIFKELNPNLAINRLDDNFLVLDILKRWGKSAKWKFFVKEDLANKQSKGNISDISHQETVVTSVTTSDSLVTTKSNTHKAPILICASEKNSGI